MGGGSWTVGSYNVKVAATAAAGKSTFDYSDRAKSGKVNKVELRNQYKPA